MSLKGGHPLGAIETIAPVVIERLLNRLSISTAEELIAQWYSQGSELASELDLPAAAVAEAVAEATGHVDDHFLEQVRAHRHVSRSYGARNPYSREVDDARSRHRDA
jgi:hypothetical protein